MSSPKASIWARIIGDAPMIAGLKNGFLLALFAKLPTMSRSLNNEA